MFTPALLLEVPKTIPTTTVTEDRPPQPELNEERGPTTSIPALQAISSKATFGGILHVSAIHIQAVEKRLSHAESHLTQLVHQNGP